MSTAVVISEANASTGALTQENQTYRRYVTFGTDPDTAKSVITKERILAEADKKDKDTGLSVNWAKAEADGFTLLSENSFVSYDVKSFEGAEVLSPDAAIRLYIYQRGLAAIQTANANAAMKALKEGTAEPEPLFNQETIDLRIGDDEGNYSINRAPQRRATSDWDKLRKLLVSLGKTPVEIDALIEAMQTMPVEAEV